VKSTIVHKTDCIILLEARILFNKSVRLRSEGGGCWLIIYLSVEMLMPT
jgi:hypothetical protein